MAKGSIVYLDRYKQLMDFSGLQFERGITPTDIDVFLDFGQKEFVVGEIKVRGKDVPKGQRMAIDILLRKLSSSGKALGFIAWHDTPVDREIDVSACQIVEYWSNGKWFYPGDRVILVRQLIDDWRRHNRVDNN